MYVRSEPVLVQKIVLKYKTAQKSVFRRTQHDCLEALGAARAAGLFRP
eukprot:COSAG06_NODE_24651_length_656_cov_2.382406_1_plen_47_part_10